MFPIGQPNYDEPEAVHTAWRIARMAWQKEVEATALLNDVAGRVSDETQKYLEEGVSYAARYADETVATLFETIRATRRTEPRAIPA